MTKKLIENLPNLSLKERSLVRERCQDAISKNKSNSGDARSVLRALDALEQEEADEREAGGYRKRIEYAFRAVPPTENECKMISAIGDPGGEVSTDMLAKKMGWKDHSAWNLHFGNMAKRRAAFLGRPAGNESTGFNYYTEIFVLVDEYDRIFHEPIIYRLMPEVIEAFIELGLLPQSARYGYAQQKLARLQSDPDLKGLDAERQIAAYLRKVRKAMQEEEVAKAVVMNFDLRFWYWRENVPENRVDRLSNWKAHFNSRGQYDLAGYAERAKGLGI